MHKYKYFINFQAFMYEQNFVRQKVWFATIAMVILVLVLLYTIPSGTYSSMQNIFNMTHSPTTSMPTGGPTTPAPSRTPTTVSPTTKTPTRGPTTAAPTPS